MRGGSRLSVLGADDMTYRQGLDPAATPVSAAPNGPCLWTFAVTRVIPIVGRSGVMRDRIEVLPEQQTVAGSFFRARAQLERDGVGHGQLTLLKREDLPAEVPDVPVDRWAGLVRAKRKYTRRHG